MRPRPLPRIGVPSGGYSGRDAVEAQRQRSASAPSSCPRCHHELLPSEKLVDSVGAVHTVRACLTCSGLWVQA